jgi:hypothetical protein
MTRGDVDRVLAAIDSVWESSEAEHDAPAMYDRVTAAVRALAGGDAADEPATGVTCGPCNSDPCRCNEYGLR